MKLKLAVPELRRVAELLAASVREGNNQDLKLRDRVLDTLAYEINSEHRRCLNAAIGRSRYSDAETTRAKVLFRSTGHKGA